ncbi:radical SAM protein [bacterium]|nr:radical SAM protein [bacterium]
MKYIYGPVSSYRLGRSLGIDILSQEEKICTFGCIYCQLGRKVRYVKERRVYVKTEDILAELEALPVLGIDHITFSGRGESTLAENLGEAILKIKEVQEKPVAVLTNSSLMNREDVIKDLSLADVVIAKLDSFSEESLNSINKPDEGIRFGEILEGIKNFRKGYSGKLGLQIMLCPQNKNEAESLAELAHQIMPDEVQLSTPLRKCPIRPLSEEEVSRIKRLFSDFLVVTVYDSKSNETKPISKEETAKRRESAYIS